MKFIKPLRLLVMPRPYRWRNGVHLAVTIAATFEDKGGTPLILPEHAWMQETLPELDADEMLDYVMPKPHPEFLVSGNAYTAHQDEKRHCMVSVRVADKRKDVLAFGDRHWTGNRISSPQPFDCMPLTWGRSFGGGSVPENPLGVGLDEAEFNGVRAVPLPNVESPTERIHSRGQMVRPCNLGQIRIDWPPRIQRLGTWDAEWLENVGTGFFDDMQPTAFNGAADDQIWHDRDTLPLGASFEIWNMQQEQPCWSGTLPEVQARCFIRRRFGDGQLDEMPMRCTTVWFVPHQSRYILLFHGTLPINDDDGYDVSTVMAALERTGQPRPQAHYEHIYALRDDRQQAVLHALNDDELMPADMLAPWIEKLDFGSNALLSKVDRMLGESGFPPGVFVGPTKPKSLSDLPEMVESNRKYQQELMAELQAERDARNDPAWLDSGDKAWANSRKLQQDVYRSLDFAGKKTADDIVLPHRGPPEIKGLYGEAKSLEGRRDYREMAAALDRKSHEMTSFLRSSMNKVYLYSVHYQSGVAKVGEHQASLLRNRVLKKYRLGRNLSKMDLTGADLSGMDLSGADFSEAWLENADLSGCNLSGAKFDKTVLARAQFRATQLDDAKFLGCNISQADFQSCTARGALWRNVISEKGTRLQSCTFEDATFDKFDFEGATLTDVHFVSTLLDSIDFRACALANCSMTGTKLFKTDFYECTIRDSALHECLLEGPLFDGTSLANVELEKCHVLKTTFMSNAKFDGCRILENSFLQTMFRAVRFTDVDLSGCVFERCDLSEAVFERCALRQIRTPQTMFIRASFNTSDLSGSNFMHGIFQKADFIGARLARCNFFRADMSETLLDPATDISDSYVQHTRLVPRRPPGAQSERGQP
ncbi:DUF2169 domain-containing protein [Bordetella petrii]|uniref:DUF2169 domain-containing protein n=1 Tax=Bordetella petrii TaxID=94624 RepID=UPI001A96CA62|nr:DUF2169 domain-containing protein [Bordetella petrii]